MAGKGNKDSVLVCGTKTMVELKAMNYIKYFRRFVAFVAIFAIFYAATERAAHFYLGHHCWQKPLVQTATPLDLLIDVSILICCAAISLWIYRKTFREKWHWEPLSWADLLRR